MESNNPKKFYSTFGVIFDIESKEKEIQELEKLTHDPSLWDNPEKAQTLLKKLSLQKEIIQEWSDYHKELEDLTLLLQMSKEEESPDIISELDQESNRLLQKIRVLELRGIMSAPEDSKEAIL
ncbi:MAG: PCRF domain-containing protein, partial [Calditrichia bacterium]|nr:PCRF domain-containing protein [Calditrichia bacterium]